MLDPTVGATATDTGGGASLTVPAQAANNIGINAVNNDHLSMYWVTVATNPVYITYGASAATDADPILGVGTFGPMILGPGTVIQILATTGHATLTILRARLV
jgi:hypothetical protein